MTRASKFFRAMFVVAVLAQTSAAFSAPAADPASRPASKKDLVGTWDMVSVRPAANASDPGLYPYQRFVFNSDASMKYMTSKDPFTAEWLDRFRKQPAEIDYRVDEKGILSLMWQKQSHEENALCAYVLKDVPPDLMAKIPQAKRAGLPKRGDIAVSFLNSKGKIAYQKVLTKIA